MSRRPSRVSVDTRQNDTLLEFETFKKKFLLANKHITKLNSTLSVRIEELNAQISSLYVENLRLRASEIALASQLKKEREKSRKILEDAEAATHALMKQLGHIRKVHHVSRESSSPEPEPAPAPRARRPVIDPNASPPPNRIARAPTVPALYEEDEEEDDVQSSPTPRRRKSKSRAPSSTASSSSRLPLPTRTSSPPPDHSPLKEFEEQLIRAGKKKPTRRQSGLLTASMSITTATPSGYKTEHVTPRPPSPAFGSPLRRDAALEEEEDQVLSAMGVAVPGDEDEIEEPIAASVTRRKRKSKEHDDDEPEHKRKDSDGRRSRYKEDEEDDEGERRQRDKRRSRDRDGSTTVPYEGKKPKLKDITNSPPLRLSLATADTHDGERHRTPINDPSPSSATSSSSSARTFLTTPTTTPPETQLPTPRASSPIPPPESEQPAGGRERRVRKSVNYAEPKLNTKMRKPDPPPPPPSVIKRSSSASEHAPRRSIEKSSSTDSLAARHAAEGSSAPPGVKRKKSRAHVPTDDDESDGTQADGEYGIRASSSTSAWVADGRRRSAAASVSRRAENDEGRRHSMAV